VQQWYILCNTEIKLEEYMSKVASTVVAFYFGYLFVKKQKGIYFQRTGFFEIYKNKNHSKITSHLIEHSNAFYVAL